jgi:ferric-dicitrate binding protein FerR (iron transport regulator)
VNREQHNIDELLVKYLLGEADAQEHLTLNKWRDASPVNEKYAQHFELIWKESKAFESKSNLDENEAWERLKRKIEGPNQQENNAAKRIALNWKNITRIAAVLVVMLGAGYFIFSQQSHKMQMVSSEMAVRIETLPDGSVVTLNKNASISYPKKFSGRSRTVVLNGEAFFNITPNKEKPFIIQANGVDIKVVGTSFNVKSAATKTEVIVETGIVEVSKNENIVRLSPKEKAIVNATSEKPLKENSSDMLYTYYRSNEFECINIPLWRVVEVLNEAYQAQIIIANPEIKDLRFRTNLINQNLDDNLAIIAETLDISIEKRGNEILLK